MKIIKQKKMCISHIKSIILANNRRRSLIKISVYLIFLCIVTLILLIPKVNKTNNVEEKPERFKTDLKHILFWKRSKKNKKNFYNRDVEYSTGQTQFIKQNCPYINCYITYNKSLLLKEENFDAIVFNIHDLKKFDVPNMKLRRRPNQLYIFKSQESAEHHPLCNPFYDNFFNLTWTYKLNSDIPHPFINIHNNKNDIIGPNKTIDWVKKMEHTYRHKSKLNGKVKAVAWLVTNCKSKQKYKHFVKDFREELEKYNYTLDTFGPCSEKRCPKGSILKCFKMISKEYYFNLLLEDSFAEDYVTEKMVKGMTYYSLPIVNGLTNYTHFLPPASYINAHNFNIKELGYIVNYLIKNPEKYSYFFDWKSYYYYTTRSKTYICNLCTKLNEDNNKKIYKELRRWWNPEFENICQRTELYNLFRDTP